MKDLAPVAEGSSRRTIEESVVTSNADGTTTIIFPSDHIMGFRPTPDGGGEASVHVANAIEALHKYEATAKRNGGLTQKEQGELTGQIRHSMDNMQSFSLTVSKSEAELYAPPEPRNQGDVLIDYEIRSALRTAPVSQRGAMFHKIQAEPRVCLAVIRSPLPMEMYTEVARHVWRATVQAENPDSFAKITRQRDSVEWARPILTAALNIAKKLPVTAAK